jgi:hypothetical protein
MLKHVLLVLVAATFSLGAFSAHASDLRTIKWNELVSDSTFPDPFKKLTSNQLADLSFVIRIRNLLAEEKVTADGPEVKEAAEIELSLKKVGIDVAWLDAQRRRVGQMREIQAKAVRQSVIDTRVKLSGYVVPVKKSDGLVTEFLLVGDFAACSHSASPPPNQIVYVKTRDGIRVGGRFAAVTVTGRVEARQTTSTFLRASGPVQFVGAYAMSPERIDIHASGK